MHLASSDLIKILQMFVKKVNNISTGDFNALSRQSIAPWLLESKLSGLVAKVFRTYQREYKKYCKENKSKRKDIDELKRRQKKMQKAASDLFIDQVRDKIGPYGGSKLKSTFIEHAIIKH